MYALVAFFCLFACLLVCCLTDLLEFDNVCVVAMIMFVLSFVMCKLILMCLFVDLLIHLYLSLVSCF